MDLDDGGLAIACSLINRQEIGMYDRWRIPESEMFPTGARFVTPPKLDSINVRIQSQVTRLSI